MKTLISRSWYTKHAEENVIKSETLENGIEYYISKSQNVRNPNSVLVTAFSGKRNKPDIYCLYRSLAQAEGAVKAWLDGLSRVQEWKTERKEATRKARDNKTVKIGDVFVASWGYDQTNVDAYQVVALKGTASVVVKEICLESVPGSAGFMSETVKAIPGKFVKDAKETTHRVSAHGDSISIRIDECRTAHYEKEIRPHYCSWYA